MKQENVTAGRTLDPSYYYDIDDAYYKCHENCITCADDIFVFNY